MKKTVLYLALLIIGFSSCKKKELPVQNSEEPVFYLNYFLNGTSQRIEAGNNDYFMSTNWSQDTSMVYVLQGDLMQSAGTAMKGNAISLLFNDVSPSTPNASMKVDSILKLGSHLLNNQLIQGTSQKLSFTADKVFNSSSTYQWELNDGNGDIRTFSGYSITEELPLGKSYSVSLKYDDNIGGCATTHTNVFRVGSKLQTKIIAKRDTSTPEFKYTFSYPLPYTGGTFSCAWKSSDGYTSSMKSPTHLFNPGTYLISLMLVDLKTSYTCYSYYQLNAANGTVCEANFSATFSEVQNSTFFATATVLLTEPDGTVFSSRHVAQPASSNLEIISVSDYKHDAHGNPTKSVKVKFNCVLQNGNRQMTLTNAEGVIAVGYKP